ncbi:MAG TPA: hypothetical protein RMH85_34210 [Polyangiaceae bacterium LLY-WYZ-15_(1-7)]|nr:hypothetical protein [Myxococcales bacterium]MBJ74000.1 hypothetical protein [Sandaracinus sp.]HJK89365.1 hypothetical protein [Polyangiaceae bacterium LLY-WYZ-15_(1-7)]HJL03023.1 hypothetical protein [Polyangiaceae bacterium LLY-WYZ-15_(1-7)]HJL13589.1 hypothetical protein [Polyangiaceae bacterium LLY-WYZ-15_(1-7)]
MKRVTKLGPWARPTLLGPFLPLWALVTWATWQAELEGVFDAQPFFDVETWAQAMLIVSGFAAVVAFHLVVADVLLLRAKLRQLPTGFRGWIGSMLAPFATVLAWSLLPGGDGGGVLGAVLLLVAGFFLGAFAVRLVFGKRFSAR